MTTTTPLFTIKEPLKDLIIAEIIRNKKIDIHQAIMNIAYDEYDKWLKKENEQRLQEGKFKQHWTYTHLLSYVETNYGSLAEFAILMGKYNQQVCNGGHEQYWYNSYASIDKWADIDHHVALINYFKDFMNDPEIKDVDSSILSAIWDILKRFNEDLEFYKDEIIGTLGFDEYGEIESREENLSKDLTESSRIRLERLDNKYYQFENSIIDILERYFINNLFTEEEEKALETQISIDN